MRDPRISELEHSAWSMFSFMGRGPAGRIVDTPTRLVIETPVHRPLRDQAEALLAPMVDRGVTPIWLVDPTTDPACSVRREFMMGEPRRSLRRPVGGRSQMPWASCRSYSTVSNRPSEIAINPSASRVHCSQPLKRTAWPVPPGPVFVAS